MTKEDLYKWADDFKSIVYWKGLVISRNNDIKTLTRYDNNGSHNDAIIKAIGYRDEAVKTFKEKLKGYEYEYIMASVRQGKYLLSKTQIKTLSTRESYIEKFENFNPFNK